MAFRIWPCAHGNVGSPALLYMPRARDSKSTVLESKNCALTRDQIVQQHLDRLLTRSLVQYLHRTFLFFSLSRIHLSTEQF